MSETFEEHYSVKNRDMEFPQLSAHKSLSKEDRGSLVDQFVSK